MAGEPADAFYQKESLETGQKSHSRKHNAEPTPLWPGVPEPLFPDSFRIADHASI